MSTPVDKRIRDAIIRARALGRSYEDIAAMVGVGRATVNRTLVCIERGVRPITMVDEITDILVARGGIQTSGSAVARAMQ